MLRLCLALSITLLGAGCTRAAFALLIPKLDLRCALHQLAHRQRSARPDARPEPEVARVHAQAGVFLRWQPRVEARSVPSPYELTPAAWLAPCDESDLECLREVAEAEHEVAAALRDQP